MTLRINVNTRDVRRRLRSGDIVMLRRYILSYRDPRTRKRSQEFFERHKDALARRDQLIADYKSGAAAIDRCSRSLTVADAIKHWLANREGEVSARTIRGYREASRYITEPVLAGTAQDRYRHTTGAESGKAARFVPVLGHLKVSDLTTAAIREWHRTISSEVGAYSANRAKKYLRAALALAAEDYHLRPPPMPAQQGRGRTKPKKAILTSDQVATLIKSARSDLDYGLYVAFPFMTGVRPCELLGLLWADVDFDAGVIRIRRSQGDKGELLEVTKTEAGMRDIPMGPMLKAWLLEWRVRCPRRAGELHRVFPGHGRLAAWPQKRVGGGGALSYSNFRRRIWLPGLKRAGVPAVTPHSARHFFVSQLQAQGVEVGLVAKLAGHANPTVTLGHYTQAVRGGAEAINALEQAFEA
jgi:integrase